MRISEVFYETNETYTMFCTTDAECLNAGTCLNTTSMTCECPFPWKSQGDMAVDSSWGCDVNQYGVVAVWTIVLVVWLIVFLSAAWTMKVANELDSSRRKSTELCLLCLKLMQGTLFITAAGLQMSSRDRIIGVDLATTLICSTGVALFWLDFHFFLTMQTLSNVTSLAVSLSGRKKLWYDQLMPFMACATTVISYIPVLTIYFASSAVVLALLHNIFFALFLIGLLTYYTVNMTFVLRDLNAILAMVSSSTRATAERNRVIRVRNQVAEFRLESFFQISVAPIVIVLTCIPIVLQFALAYAYALVWASAGWAEARYIYVSYQTMISKRQRRQLNSEDSEQTPKVAAKVTDSDAAAAGGRNYSSGSPTSAASTGQPTSFHSNSAGGKHHKFTPKRNKKPIKVLSPVEEERTVALTVSELPVDEADFKL